MKFTRSIFILILLCCGLFTACANIQPVETQSISAEDLTATEIGSWHEDAYPLLAALPEQDAALYALDIEDYETDDFGDSRYFGRVAFRLGEQVQIFDWDEIFDGSQYPTLAAGDYDHDGKTEYACTSVLHRDIASLGGTLHLIQSLPDNRWDVYTLTEQEIAEALTPQLSEASVQSDHISFLLNGEQQDVILPEDLRDQPMQRLAVLPYIRFHSETSDELSVSAALGAYFDGETQPILIGYVNAPILLEGGQLHIGSAVWGDTFFRGYPSDWMILCDSSTGITLGLPETWAGNYIDTGAREQNGRQLLFDLYEKYNFELPQNAEGHYGFLLSIYTRKDTDDPLNLLGYRNGKAYYCDYPRGIEFNDNDLEARFRYQPLSFDQNTILEHFIVMNHLTPRQTLVYWSMMA